MEKVLDNCKIWNKKVEDSNIYELCYWWLMFICRTRSATREDKALMSYLEVPPGSAWLDNCYEAEGPLYQCTLSLLLLTPARWKSHRLTHLNRLLVLAHQRYVSPSATTKTIMEPTTKEYTVYKSTLIFFGLVDCIYGNFFKVKANSQSFLTILCVSKGCIYLSKYFFYICRK